MNAQEYARQQHLQLIEGEVKTYNALRDALDASHEARIAEINAMYGFAADPAPGETPKAD